MSPIGRVFIVLNLVLSGVFLGYAGFYLGEADKWKNKHEDAVAAMTKMEGEKNAEITQLKSTLDVTQGERDDQTRQAATLRNAVAAKDDQIQNLNGRLTTLQSSYQGLEANVGTLAQASEKQNERIAELSKLYLEAKDQRAQAVAARDQMNEELEAERSSRRGTEEKNQGLQDRIASANQEIRDYELRMDAIVAAVPNIAEIIAGTLPPVSGEVFAVNTDLKTVFLRLNDGAIDKVSKGWRFSIHNGNTYKGEISIIDVDTGAKTATGRIVASNAAIQRGDRAETRISRK